MAVLSLSALNLSTGPSAYAEIERIVRSLADAVNDRDLSSSSPIWSQLSTDFEFTPPHQAQPGTQIPTDPDASPRQRFLDFMKAKVAEAPEYLVHVSDVNVEIGKDGKAKAWVNQTFTGVPTGLVRSASGVVTLKLENGRWVLVKYEVPMGMGRMPGFDGMVSHCSGSLIDIY